MLRKIIKIDEYKCNGCGLCAKACHEGAIEILNGKAKVTREDYCDGLGDCLHACPTGAITFEEREALEYNEEAVNKAKENKKDTSCGCPGANQKNINKENISNCISTYNPSRLLQWPIQINLVSVNADYFDNAHLLVAADCTAFAYGNFHNDFIKNKICIIACPKLDMVDYSEKLAYIISNNDIKSITVVRMEVPCCGGIENAVKRALLNSGKFIPWEVITISIDGNIIE